MLLAALDQNGQLLGESLVEETSKKDAQLHHIFNILPTISGDLHRLDRLGLRSKQSPWLTEPFLSSKRSAISWKDCGRRLP